MIVVLFLWGCGSPDDRWSRQHLYIDPSSAMQGMVIPVDITSPTVPLEKCSYVEPSDLTFINGNSDDFVHVATLQIIPSGAIRAGLIIDEDAKVGAYEVEYRCDHSTVLSGTFEVRARNKAPTIELSVKTAVAGTANLSIDITASEPTFVEGVSHAVFGDGDSVIVTNEMVVTGSQTMRVKINISALAPTGEMDVAVTTGSIVARGKFYIKEKKYLTVQVEDDEIVRSALGDNPTQASLLITGRDTWFLEPSDEEDAGLDAGATEVTFPMNPGITVDMINVKSPTMISANISVVDNAVLGPTPLVVSTGEETAITDFTVLAHLDEPVLEIEPNVTWAGKRDLLLLMKTTNLILDDTLLVKVIDSGCIVNSFYRISSSEAVAFVSVGNNYKGDTVNLEISAGGQRATAFLRIVSTDKLGTFVELITGNVHQGDISDSVTLRIYGGLFDTGDIVSVDDRTGLRIRGSSPTFAGNSMVVDLDVAPDAPCGVAAIYVFTNGARHSVYLDVLPRNSGVDAYLSFEPPMILSGRRSMDLDVTIWNESLDTGALALEVDDPSINVESIEYVDSESARSSLSISPASASGSTVFYLQNGSDRISGSVRSIERVIPTASTGNFEISRSNEVSVAKILFNLDGFDLEHLAASVFDDIGLEVERLSWITGNQIELEFKVAPDGPGGWLGVLVSDGMTRIAVPIHLIGDDDSLTAKFSDTEFKGWNRLLNLTMLAPAEAQLDDALSFAHTTMNDAYIALVSVSPANHTAFLNVEIPYSYSGDQLPIIVTAQKGAVVGFLDVASIEVVLGDELEHWNDYLELGDVRFARTAGLEYPALVRVSRDRHDYGNLDVCLLSYGDLDCQTSAPGGFFFVLRGDSEFVFTPSENPHGLPQSVDVFPIGGMTPMNEDNNDVTNALTVTDDPCQKPFLGFGRIDEALDLDRIELPETTCRLVADVVGRGLIDESWATPDLSLTLRRSLDDSLIRKVTSWPTDADLDARIYIEPGLASRQIVVAAEQGTEGTYFLNVRRSESIEEVCRGSAQPFIELSMEPGTALDNASLVLRDSDTGATRAMLSLLGVVPDDGLVVIGDVAESWVDIADTAGVSVIASTDGFVLNLVVNGKVVDAVQVGDGGDFGEGTPVVNDSSRCFFRVAGVDTNDNQNDFIGAWKGTPGKL